MPRSRSRLTRLGEAFLLLTVLLVPFSLYADSSPSLQRQAKSVPHYPRLTGALEQVLESPDPLEAAPRNGFRVFENRIQVHIDCTSEEAARAVVRVLEMGSADSILNLDRRVQAWVPPSLLHTLAALEGITRIDRPVYFTRPPAEPLATRRALDPAPTAGSYMTEGFAAMNGPAWHTAGITGQGVNVGIIDSFWGYENLLGGDLPPSSKVEFTKVGGGARDQSPHGTACAEIIYDIAPGLNRMYLMEISSILDAENAIQSLQSKGVRLISASIGFDNVTPMDGNGPLITALANFKSAGGLYVAAAGNERKKTWWGTFRDPNGNEATSFSSTSNDEVNEFVYEDGSTIDYPAGKAIAVKLTWNQWSSPQTDLDLWLVRLDTSDNQWKAVAKSEEYQTGQPTQSPFEKIEYTTDRAGRYGIVVWRTNSGPSNVDMHIYFTQSYSDVRMKYTTASMSLSYPSDDANTFAVAALDAKSPYNLESYSSAGPTAGSGGSISGGRRKPDIAGYANVSTASYQSLFNGTSSATPHVAGASALTWSANPGWTATQVRSFLEGRAKDMGSSGADNDYGYGQLWLGSPSATTTRTLTVSKGGSGSGTVSSSPAGISCGGTCSASFSDGTAVTLTATSSSGSTFAGWGGACSGTGSCQVSMTSDRTVTATFNASGGGGQEMFLSQDRVAVSLTWRNHYNGASGNGTPVKQMDQYGYFWFDSATNPEVFVKVLDFGGTNYLVFHSALSDLEYTVNFRVIRTGQVYSFNRPPGSVCGLANGDTVRK
ncbi:MAG: S8 family serine peptidase [Acidobacteria bacterium]|nr:S8 family serine peptidase [Acidobacteriota bacterium]